MPNAYRIATNYVCDVVEDVIVDGKLDFPESTFADTVFHFTDQASYRHEDITNVLNPLHSRVPIYEFKPGLEFYLVELAKVDCEFYDYLLKACSARVLAELPLTSPLSSFVYDVLLGNRTRPKKASRPRNRDWMEKNYLWSITNELVHDFGLTLTRNDSTAAKTSACDAVAEALTVCGRNTRYTEIKNLMVHPDNFRRRKEFEVARKLYSRHRDDDAPKNAVNPEYWKYWFDAAQRDVLEILSTFPSNGEKSETEG